MHAEEQKPVLTLPTMTIMAEPEMSNETGYVPFIENEANRLALQHQVIREPKMQKISWLIQMCWQTSILSRPKLQI